MLRGYVIGIDSILRLAPNSETVKTLNYHQNVIELQTYNINRSKTWCIKIYMILKYIGELFHLLFLISLGKQSSHRAQRLLQATPGVTGGSANYSRAREPDTSSKAHLGWRGWIWAATWKLHHNSVQNFNAFRLSQLKRQLQKQQKEPVHVKHYELYSSVFNSADVMIYLNYL